MFSTANNKVTKMVTEVNWLKGKTLIQELVDDLKQNPEAVLQEIRKN